MKDRRRLGLDRDITRRDFVHVAGLGLAGAGLSGCGWAGEEDAGSRAAPGAAGADEWSDSLGPAWYGPGGVGDYSSSHGNTPEVVRVAHGLRIGRYEDAAARAEETGERYDVIVVGAGIAGLSAAHRFGELYPEGRCLVLDNHPVFGGEAKRNELEVDGVRLIGPQGSNDFTVGPATGGPDDYFSRLGIPRQFEYAPWDRDDLRVPLDNYGFMHWVQDRYSVGHFFEAGDTWIRDLWRGGLERSPWAAEVRAAFRSWRSADFRDHAPPAVDRDGPPRWLDGLTLKAWYEGVLGLPGEVTRYVDPILASIIGLGCDAVSAWWGYHFSLPGFGGPSRYDGVTFHSFPGGNAGIARYFVKDLVPDAIAGGRDLGDVIGGSIDFAALDRQDAPVRLRLGATVVDVAHVGPGDRGRRVRVVWVRGDRVYVAEASAVVMATGGWVNRNVVADLPASHEAAYAEFRHAPILVANVALRHWRFMERLGVAACLYEGDLGFSCNIRRPMYAGAYRPPFGPDRPAILTFYITFEHPGEDAASQGARGRRELLSTPFEGYERRLREQMLRLFGAAGFDPAQDIAGIVLNRWGHAYLAPGPGFRFGAGDRAAPSDVIRRPFGRVAIGHSELRGHQNWTGAAGEGRRAMEEVVERFA